MTAANDAVLYGYFRSSAAYRVRIALGLKGLNAQHRFVHLRKGEQTEVAYRSINPAGLVPYGSICVPALNDEAPYSFGLEKYPVLLGRYAMP